MSKVRIQFDPNQEHQNEAVESVVSLLDGLFYNDTSQSFLSDEIVPNIPPHYQFDVNWLQDNLNEVQRRFKIPQSLSVEMEAGFLVEGVSSDTWEYPAFTVDMETGTGKTYVYTKTIYALHKKYGLKKFIIIVPSVAIYEGVINSFNLTRGHFKSLFNNEVAHLRPYEGSKPGELKNFAIGHGIEILIMTIDSFNKKTNTIFKKSDKLMGEFYPYQYIQQTRPILILDESQNYTTEIARAALRTLKPLFAINYSATPGQSAKNFVYKLTAFEAYKRNLVKKIEVLGLMEAQSAGHSQDYINLLAIETKAKKITARFHLMANKNGSYHLEEFTLADKANLAVKTKNEAYEGWVIDEINVKDGYVSFKNGERLFLSEERQASFSKEGLFRKQIEETIKEHISKQRELRGYGIKVLSLFFIDRVANYVEDEGIIKKIFDETFEKLKKKSPEFSMLSAEKVREGYFAKKKASKKESESFVDTALEENDKTNADKEAEKAAYELIMKNKERLLSFDEPVSFIFAHSALREGWDNPNVFQICALREISSEKQRRQTIGRGLRLPVDQNGERLLDRRLNKLTVIANESYSRYVEKLQQEYAESGDVMPGAPADASKKEKATRNDSIYNSRDFKNFWNELVRRTEYTIKIDTEDFINKCVEKLNITVFPEPHVIISRGSYVITNFRIELLEVENSEAKIRVTISDSLEREEISTNTYKKNDDLSKKLNNPIFKGFKIIDIIGSGSTGRVIFSDIKELRKDEPIIFSTEQGQAFSSRLEKEDVKYLPKFNLIDRTAQELSITRPTVLSIFKQLSKQVKQAFIKNPEGFASVFISVIQNILADHVAERIEYAVTDEVIERDMEQMFPPEKLYPAKEVKAGNEDSSLYDAVQFDSENELKFIERLNEDGNVILYFKFPAIFKINIPRIIGNYNPDWGILRWSDDHIPHLKLVRETKGNIDLSLLQHSNEGRKIRCAEKHFASLGMSYRHITSDTLDWWKERGQDMFK